MNKSNIQHNKSQLLTLLQTIDNLNKLDDKMQDLFGTTIDDSVLATQLNNLCTVLVSLLGLSDSEYIDSVYDILLFDKSEINDRFEKLLEISLSEEGD